MNSKKHKQTKEITQQGTYYQTFTAYLQSQNIQPKYIKLYEKQTERYKKWLLAHRDITPDNAQKKDLLDFLQYLQEKRNLSSRTRQQFLGILRHYYTFLCQREEVETNPANSIKLRGTRKKGLPKILSLDQMNDLLDRFYLLKVKPAPDEYRHIYQRNYLILSLCAYQGITRSQLETLTIDDVDLHKATLTVPQGHKSNARTLPLQASQMGIFYEYLNHARPLFAKENGKLINSNPEYQKLLTSTKKVYPKFTDLKQLRASIITYWLQTDGLRKAQYKAGHRYISSTEEYLANDLESLKDDIDKFHPI